jgi:iron-sulfur cluster assembly accessory protein
MLMVDESAIKQIQYMRKSEQGFLKIEIGSGGCSGFEIAFDWVTAPDAEDLVFENAVCVHPDFVELMGSAKLVYESRLMQSSFGLKVESASSTCGCGMSFSL